MCWRAPVGLPTGRQSSAASHASKAKVSGARARQPATPSHAHPYTFTLTRSLLGDTTQNSLAAASLSQKNENVFAFLALVPTFLTRHPEPPRTVRGANLCSESALPLSAKLTYADG